MDNCCRPHPRKNRGRWTDRRSCPPRQGSALKGFFKEKKEQKRKSAKPPQATARLSFAALQDRRALPLSYVKNNVVTQDGPPCSGLSADMIGLRPITSHALRDTSRPAALLVWPTPWGKPPRVFKWCCGLTRSTVAEPYACEA